MTILLRGANDYMLDEMDRSLHDSLCVVKRVLESGTLVPGGGSVEAALSIYLENFATTLGSREQLAIAEFADALLVRLGTCCWNDSGLLLFGACAGSKLPAHLASKDPGRCCLGK